MKELKETVLQGFRFHDAPIEWVLAPIDPKTATLQQLLQKFYAEFDPRDDEELFRPLAFVRNPVDQELRPFYGEHEAILVAYRRSFIVTMECAYRAPYGPHAVRLLYKSWQTSELIWVAILQIEEFFFSDEKMLTALTDKISKSNFFQTPKTASTIIIL